MYRYRPVFAFFGLFILFSACHSAVPDPGKTAARPAVFPAETGTKRSQSGPFDPNGELVFTKHARCRMDCRHITAKEIHEILEGGTINYQKSQPVGHPDPKYAVEGYTQEQQHLRIIVAPENRKLIIVTCIELGVEWSCHCN